MHLLENSNDSSNDHGKSEGMMSDVGIRSNELERYMFHEDYATDSYQNILLSLVQFPIWLEQLQNSSSRSTIPFSLTRSFPQHHLNLVLPRFLTIISHAFKRSRFMDLHLPAIRSLLPSHLREQFDQMEVTYIGIDPDLSEKKLEEIREGDRKRGYGVWEKDLFGKGVVLSGKRKGRGWDEGGFLQGTCTWFEGEDRRMVEKLIRGESRHEEEVGEREALERCRTSE